MIPVTGTVFQRLEQYSTDQNGSQVNSRRAQQAIQTRREILGAARQLFASQGYQATRIADIAAAAGVSPQTIYDSVGSKSAIAAGLMDGMEEEVGLADLIPSIVDGADADGVIGTQLELSRRFVALAGDLLRTLGQSGEPELRSIREEGRRRHRFGVAAMIGRLQTLGALRPGIDVERAADLVAALTDGDLLISLVDHANWQLDDAIAAVRRMVDRELLDV